ncbi:MAG: ribose ABC transporter permease, partial [Christensenellaceae bacterium]|nr:ribose ABC transporter permease [Christensenellaceae bacterium]
MKTNIKKKLDITTLAPIIFLLVLVVVYSIFAKNFLSGPNILNILRQVSITGIMAIGVTMVILLGEIDLSIGTVMAFCGMMVGGLSTGKYFGLPALPVGVAIIIT